MNNARIPYVRQNTCTSICCLSFPEICCHICIFCVNKPYQLSGHHRLVCFFRQGSVISTHTKTTHHILFIIFYSPKFYWLFAHIDNIGCLLTLCYRTIFGIINAHCVSGLTIVFSYENFEVHKCSHQLTILLIWIILDVSWIYGLCMDYKTIFGIIKYTHACM